MWTLLKQPDSWTNPFCLLEMETTGSTIPGLAWSSAKIGSSGLYVLILLV